MRRKSGIWDPAFPFDPAKSPVFYGWIILGAAIVGFIASIPGQTMGVSVYTDLLIEHLGLSRIELTTAYLIGTTISGFLVPYGGILFDRLGARRFFVLATLLFGASLIYLSQMDRLLKVVGLAGVSLCATIAVSIGFFGIRFLGQGMVTLGSRSMLAKWWNHKRGLMVAISGCFVAFGFSLAPRFLDWEIAVFGWRGSLLVNALLLICVLSVLSWLVCRDNPEECGLEMDNGWHPPERRLNPDTLLLKEFTRKEAMRTFSFWMMTAILAFHGFFATAYTFHVIDLGRTFSVPRETILNFFIYSSFLSVAANVTCGLITDFIRLRFVMVVFCLFGFLFCAGVLLLPGTLGRVLLVSGMGVSWGIFPVISSIGFARYFGRAHIGSINGASLSWMVWGSALGPLAFSFSKDFMGGYEVILLLSAAVYGLLAICAFWAQNPSKASEA